MDANSVDERDVEFESQPDGYRVLLVRPGRVVSAFNLDDCTAGEALAWAVERQGDGAFALAARYRDRPDGGVGLMWLTPPPEELMDPPAPAAQGLGSTAVARGWSG